MKLGIIGGSGLYDIESIEKLGTISIETPFGAPSNEYLHGKIGNTELYFLPRHGSGHTISPSEINHRANIFGMKKLGVTHILSLSAVGSLKEELAPKDIVFIDQYFDRTKQSYKHTFFQDGIVAHIPFAHPICIEFRDFVYKLANDIVTKLYSNKREPPKIVKDGTYINMEGPAFSTIAESKYYRSAGFDVIGMTSLAEAKLSREAEICYCTAAMVTDFDSWHPNHDNVSVEMVVNTMKSNVTIAKHIIEATAKNFENIRYKCVCQNALNFAIMTRHEFIPEKKKMELAPLIKKYVK